MQELAHFLHFKELGGLELLKARYQHTQFSKHVHEGYCIGVIEEGAQSFLRTGDQHIAPTNSIILVNADEIHTGSSAVESGWGYRAIYPTPEMIADLTRDIFQFKDITPWFPQAVVQDHGLAQQLVLLFNILEQPENSLLKESLYISTLTYLIRCHARSRPEPIVLPRALDKIQLAKELILASPEYDFSLNELAEKVGLSSWHFLREFKRIVGMPPHAWLVQIRLHKAQRLLKQGCPIAMTAQLCGFSDQSHFNRHFKRSLGVTPVHYLQHTTSTGWSTKS